MSFFTDDSAEVSRSPGYKKMERASEEVEEVVKKKSIRSIVTFS